MQHTLHKKNSYSLKSENRNSKTGNLTGKDKVARITDQEVYVMSAIGANYALQEFLSPRADNMEKKIEMNKQISNYGYVYLKDLPNNTKGQALQTGYVYLLSAGLDSDLLK